MEQIHLDIKPVDVPKSRTPSPRQSVTKHNALISTITPLDLTTQRILAATLSAINPQAPKLAKAETFRLRFDANELANLCQMHPTNIKRYLEKSLKDNALKLAQVTIEIPNSEKKGAGCFIPFFYKVEYDPSPVSITCTIHPDLLPYIHGLAGHFTSYRLSYFTSLPSKYTTRLYEVLSVGARWGSLTLFLWEPAEPDRSLYALLGLVNRKGEPVDNGYYTTYTKFKAKLLKPGIDQINELTDLTVDMGEERRRNRKVYSITFKISRREREPGVVARLRKIGISEKMAVRLEKSHSEDLLKAVCNITEEAIENGAQIESALKYVRHLLKLKIDELPEKLNPYSSLYNRNPKAQRFLTDYVVPAFFKVKDVARQGMSDLALEHPAIAPEYRLYCRLAEEHRCADYDLSVTDLVRSVNAERWLQH